MPAASCTPRASPLHVHTATPLTCMHSSPDGAAFYTEMASEADPNAPLMPKTVGKAGNAAAYSPGEPQWCVEARRSCNRGVARTT